MTLTKIASCGLVLIMLIASCKKNSNPPIPPTPSTGNDIYVAGDTSGLNNGRIAVYWKNGIRTALTVNNEDGHAQCIVVSNNDVYVAGDIKTAANKNPIATYWKNGKKINLSDGVTPSKAYSIAVNGTDVHVAGFTTTAAGKHVATYWKNGQPVMLTDASGAQNESMAFSIAVSGTDVYVGGVLFTADEIYGNATYWKNGVPVSLTNNTSYACINSMCISGSDVHAAGIVLKPFSSSVATYWKNDTTISLTNNSDFIEGYGISVSGNDVHVVGKTQPSYQSIPGVATYWKNNVPQYLSGAMSRNSVAYGVFALGEDVYIAGASGEPFSTATYWKNGEPVLLTSSGYNSVASSVFITE
jgi:hypothetical protein